MPPPPRCATASSSACAPPRTSAVPRSAIAIAIAAAAAAAALRGAGAHAAAATAAGAQDAKLVHYLSLEFLIGRSLQNAVHNLALQDEYAEALRKLGYRLEDVVRGCHSLGFGYTSRITKAIIEATAAIASVKAKHCGEECHSAAVKLTAADYLWLRRRWRRPLRPPASALPVTRVQAAEERDPALGNGGLGRLASCFLDSLATLNYPARGYGIRYRYGMFEQRIEGGRQVERPDYWLPDDGTSAWEIRRPHLRFPVRFYGHVVTARDSDGRRMRSRWEGGEVVMAVAYDTPIPGFRTLNTVCMRLWSSRPCEEFDLGSFNEGRHLSAVEARVRAEAISSVLYPSDTSDAGKELRLKQQFFFVSATLQDILATYRRTGRPLSELYTKVAVQLNDTHPSIAIPELMRLLLDQEGMEWADAWETSVRTFSYTNHTILPESLERWPVPLLQALLPRHMEIIYEINHRHLQGVEARWKDDTARLSRMSIIEESCPKMVRMAVLATVGSHTVNGVAEIHTSLVRSRLFPEFVELNSHKFQNKTNGVNHRRWMLIANPALCKVITRWLGTDAWLLKLDYLQGLKEHSEDVERQQEWRAAKQANKQRLAAFILKTTGLRADKDALFDIQVKRIHEYKRQLLNILGLIHRYNHIKACTWEERSHMVARVAVFAGKAAASYQLAKCIIHLINCVAATVNNDPDVGDLLKIVFLPNYNVSLAEVIIPANDISQHISTAGMEASGTSNMKFVMNGGLVVGTMDGANIEIADAIGRENMFIFGATAEETDLLREALKYRHLMLDDRLSQASTPRLEDSQISVHRPGLNYLPNQGARSNPLTLQSIACLVEQVFHTIEVGTFGPYDDFRPVLDPLRQGHDNYLISHDWPSYLDAQHSVDQIFSDPFDWTRRCIASTALMGQFSSDRTVQEYAQDIWRLKALPVKPSK
eukprot:SM000180S03525  [mRNA]  locus=s180:200233:205474:- [translate_table: standard]